MGLKITYKHNHECSRKGDEVVDRPDGVSGVSWIRIPTCDETLVELERIKIDRT